MSAIVSRAVVRDTPVSKVGDLRLVAGVSRAPAAWRFLPAEFYEPVIVNAEIVANLVDDGTADLLGDFPLAIDHQLICLPGHRQAKRLRQRGPSPSGGGQLPGGSINLRRRQPAGRLPARTTRAVRVSYLRPCAARPPLPIRRRVLSPSLVRLGREVWSGNRPSATQLRT